MTRGKPRCSTTFPRGEKDVDFEAAVLMNALCKPWELGGHPHDFYVAHRSARITDATQYYERDTSSIKQSHVLKGQYLFSDPVEGMEKHERMVAEKLVWSRQRAIKEEMLQLLTRLHSIEKQRRHFNAVRLRGNDDSHGARTPTASSSVNEHDAIANLQILSSSFVDHKFLPKYKDSFPPHATNHHQLTPIEHDADVPVQAPMTLMKIAERKAVEDLDRFEVQPPPKQKRGAGASGSAASFHKAKKK